MFRAVAGNVWRGWNAHGNERMAAAIAYFTMLAAAPMLTLVAIGASAFVDPQLVHDAIVQVATRAVGPDAAAVLASAVQGYAQHASGATVVAVFALFFAVLGSVDLFRNVLGALHEIWGLSQPESAKRQLSAGLTILAAVAIAVAVFAAAVTVLAFASGLGAPPLTRVLRFVVAFALLSGAFAAAYRFLSGARPAWRDGLVGAAPAALAYSIGSSFLGAFLNTTWGVSAWGAAGAILVILIWANFSATTFLVGAELTRAIAEERVATQS